MYRQKQTTKVIYSQPIKYSNNNRTKYVQKCEIDLLQQQFNQLNISQPKQLPHHKAKDKNYQRQDKKIRYVQKVEKSNLLKIDQKNHLQKTVQKVPKYINQSQAKLKQQKVQKKKQIVLVDIEKSNEKQDELNNTQKLIRINLSNAKIQPNVQNEYKIFIQKSSYHKHTSQGSASSSSPLSKQKQSIKLTTDNLKANLPLDWYNRIRNIWSITDKKQIQEPFYSTKKITHVINYTCKLLKRLKPKHWLNDQIVNSYIQLIQSDIINLHISKNHSKPQNQFSVVLMTSWFTAINPSKNSIGREINKKNITQQSFVILPICEDNHWFFITFIEKKILIFDSLLPKIEQKVSKSVIKKEYGLKSSIKNCLKLYETVYKVKQVSSNDIKLIESYPQQNNSYDCGMMMLQGIKWIIFSYFNYVKSSRIQENNFYHQIKKQSSWNFCIQDINYLRYAYMKDLLMQKLSIGLN